MSTVRPYDPQDPAARAVLAAQDIMKRRARDAMAVNDTFLALRVATPVQVTAQVAALTRQVNGLIRLLLGATDDLSDT